MTVLAGTLSVRTVERVRRSGGRQLLTSMQKSHKVTRSNCVSCEAIEMLERYMTYMFYIFALRAVVFISLGITSNHYGIAIFGFLDFLHHEYYAAWCFLVGVAIFLSWHLIYKFLGGRTNSEIE